MDMHDVLIRPIITEKSSDLMSLGQYTFRVAPTATKSEIKSAVEEIFKVQVLDVRTMKVRGKLRRQGRTSGHRPDWKKAIVQLKAGQSIQIFEGV